MDLCVRGWDYRRQHLANASQINRLYERDEPALTPQATRTIGPFTIIDFASFRVFGRYFISLQNRVGDFLESAAVLLCA
jgi:hypothetical protein